MSVLYVFLVIVFALVTVLLVMRQMHRYTNERTDWDHHEDPQTQRPGTHVESRVSERPSSREPDSPSRASSTETSSGWSRDGWFEL